MKFKEIKPGMVIHCPKEEDARVLLERLEKLGFLINEKDITHPEFEWSWDAPDGVCYAIESENSLSWGRCKKSAEDDGLIYTEFSDLIEPDDYDIDITDGKIRYGGNLSQLNNLLDDSPIDSPMSAMELLNALKAIGNDADGLSQYFDAAYSLSEVIRGYSTDDIIAKITAYEAAKKAPKPVELKWVKVFRIIQIQDSGVKKCVYEEEANPNVAYGTGEKGSYSFDPKYGAENVLKDYISKHEGRYIAVIEDVCRERLEGES